MSLDLGAVVGRVVLEDVQFQRTYVRVVRQMGQLGAEAGKAGAGTDVLDRGLARVGASGTAAATGLGRASKATTENAAANQKDAAAAARLAAATTRVSEAMSASSGASARRQVLTLRQVAADERLVASSAAVGSSEARQAAQTAKLAAAQATAIGAGERLSASQTKWATKAAAAGTTMTKKLTLPAVAAAGIAIDQAVKFQKATNVYVTAAGESEKNLGVVRAGIKSTATETGESISQLTAAQYILEKANIRGAASQTLLNAATKGSIEENANLADVVQGATSIMASYHIGTDKSVQVINALKTAAGQSKSTMEEYIKSLSTVIPIASAAGIAVSQVLGAVSTLTQHGTTPAEATQELANTIRNLQAPSNVATAALNQIGISSVNVSKNLGKRGLTGTIEYIESKLPKAGLVYLSTMKQMEAGTADLTAMQSKMPPSLAKLSKGFLDGSVTAKQYRTDIRNMGADGFAQGSQFLTLAAKVRGYNDSLKNGTPAQKTMAAELKAIFGGATGLNTVLQLGGHNLDGFKARTVAVGKSLHDSSKDVEGWSSTAKLASTQAAIAKAKLHVLAIDAGTFLLPAFNKIVGGLSTAVTWFGNLSHTDKMVIGWSIAILAALGPIISIVNRIHTAWTLMSKASSAVVGAFTSTGAAASESAVAEANAAAVFAQAEANKAEATAAAARSIAASLEGTDSILAGTTAAAAEDATAFATAQQAKADAAAAAAAEITAASEESGTASSAAFGPVGIAIGAVVGVGALAAHALGLFGGSAKKQVAPTEAFTNAILADNDALGANTRKLVENNLEKQGSYDAALKLGISQKTLTDAMMGNKTAMAQVSAAQLGVTAKYGYGTVAARNLTKEQRAQIDANAKLSAGIGDLSAVLAVNQRAADNLAAADGKGKKAKDALTTSLTVQRAAASLTAAGLKSLGGLQVSPKIKADPRQAAAAVKLIQTQIDAIRQNKNPKLNANSAAGRAVIAHLQAQINALKGKTVPLAARDHASTLIDLIQAKLNALHGKTLYINAVTLTSQRRAAGSSGAQLEGSASGTGPGGLPEGVSAVGENGPELAIKRGPHVDILSNPQAKAFLAVTGMRAPGFAGGTNASSLTSSSLDTRLITAVHQLQGALTVSLRSVAASMRAVSSRASSTVSAAIATATAPQATDSATLAKSLGRSIATATGKEQQAEIAAANYTKLAAAAAKLSAEEKAATGSAKVHALALSNAAHAAHEAAANMKAGAAKTEAEKRARALDDEARAARQNASAVTTASKSRIAALKAEAATAATVATRAKDAATAARQAAKEAADAAAEIAKNLVASLQSSADALQSSITDFETTIKSGIAGDTSLSSLWQQLSGTDANGNPLTPSLTGLQGNLDAILTQAQNFSADLTALLGDGASQDLITQLTGMGSEAGDALAKQLLAAGPAAVAALQTTMASIQTIAGNEADRLANSFFGPGVNAMQQFILGMEKQFPALKKALDPIIAEIQAALTAESGGTAKATTTAKPPGFSSGVTNFSGGLAYVHRGEALVNFTRPGSSVIPANKVKNIFDDNRIVDRLDSMSERIDGLAGRIADASDERGARLYAQAGDASARRAVRHGRKGI